MRRPVIGITMGDPKGIGPEVVQKALATPFIKKICHPLLFGDPVFFHWKKGQSLSARECGKLSGFYIDQAIHAALTRQIHAIVTGPISKEHLNLAGYRYPGHTEFLADRAGVQEVRQKVRMMMAGPKLKVVLVTIHEPFRKITALLTVPHILQTIEITHSSLKKWFGIRQPRIAVAALNPHAGEGGLFGDEEKKKIMPAVRAAQRKGIRALGPYSPDTVFHRAVCGEFDAVVAMYHDQGLIPLKLLHFEEAVNITLGLPFIRTSVDHGTAFDIAGQGIADPSSMIAAIRMAVQLTHFHSIGPFSQPRRQ